MNEPNLETMPQPTFKDRSTGLVIFGILTILLGCLAGLMVLLMLAGFAVNAKNPNVPPTPLATLLPIFIIYGGLAVGLIWLGIGSILARRWARALILIFSWVWLVGGIVMVLVMPFFLAKAFANLPATANGRPAMPPGAITGMIVGMTLVFGFFFVLLPALWVFFYNSRHVEATCETRNPVKRSTDACPLPVLGLSLWLWLGVPMLLFMPVMCHGVIPFFGVFLSGLPGSLVCVAMAALWAWCAWLLYQLDVRGWWLILIAIVLYTLSAVLTYARHNVIEMYQLMGYPQAQIDQMQKIGLFAGNGMAWWTLVITVPFLGYLLFVKKYLRAKA